MRFREYVGGYEHCEYANLDAFGKMLEWPRLRRNTWPASQIDRLFPPLLLKTKNKYTGTSFVPSSQSPDIEPAGAIYYQFLNFTISRRKKKRLAVHPTCLIQSHSPMATGQSHSICSCLFSLLTRSQKLCCPDSTGAYSNSILCARHSGDHIAQTCWGRLSQCLRDTTANEGDTGSLSLQLCSACAR